MDLLRTRYGGKRVGFSRTGSGEGLSRQPCFAMTSLLSTAFRPFGRSSDQAMR